MNRIAFLRLAAAVAAVLFAGGLFAALAGAAETAPEPTKPLPAGHPPLPQGHPQLPQGHPAMPGGMTGGTPGGMAASIPPDAKGTLVIQAVQGTRGGPTVAGDPVVVDLVHDGEVVKKIEAKLDDKGQVVLEDLPAGKVVQPMVTVTHAGAEYRMGSDLLRASPPDQRITIVVYESTEKAPPWVVRARHVFVRRTEEGLYVKDMMVVESPTDRTWLGKADAKGRRATVDVSLPKDTGRVDLYAGFPQDVTDFTDGHLINRTVLLPGTTQFSFGYAVPIVKGKASVEVVCPSDTDQVVLLVPVEDGSKAAASGLEAGDVMDMGPQKMRVYKAEKVKAGQKLAVSLSGLAETPAPEPAAPAAPHPKSGVSSLPQTMAAVGGGVILAGGATILYLKRLRPSPKTGEAADRGRC